VRQIVSSVGPVRQEIGRIRLTGWDWGSRPQWAADLNLKGVDVDASLFSAFDVETEDAVPYDRVIARMSEAAFNPVLHRPLFNELGLVTNRTFETFCADTVPMLFLPEPLVGQVYGTDAQQLRVTGDPVVFMESVRSNPLPYWDAVLKTRRHLTDHHSYEQRFNELLTHLTS
jgi:hypothetical protein